MADLQGRVALVIGGGAGIGRASARALAARGARVIIADRLEEAAKTAAEAVVADGGEARAFIADASDPEARRSLFAFVQELYGRLHIMFCNVGTRGPDGFDVTEDQFDQVFAINLKSHFFATQAAVPLMHETAGQASVIYTCSAGALRLGGRSPLYSISKSAMLMMTRAFARELGPLGVRVNAILPGSIETAFPRWAGMPPEAYQASIARIARTLPLGRIGQPEDVAELVAFLASDRASYLTGAAIPLDGGDLA